MKRVIIIMTKVPRAGNVKTRLQPILSPHERLTLSEAFLSDAVYKAHRLCDALVVAYSPSGEESYFSQFKIENLFTVEQRGKDLGEKMSNAFDFAFSNFPGAGAVMIGTDSPTFPYDFFEKAFAALESSAEIILGETTDGGFYLIGLRKMHEKLFENIDWSTSVVFRQINRNIGDLNLDLKIVPEWYDVDTPEDLLRLNKDILNNETSRNHAPKTYKWLVENAEIIPAS